MTQDTNNDLAIPELQCRLEFLGYQLAGEREHGLFGQRTAAAVTAFKEAAGLVRNDVVDQETWTALKDASMQLGARDLYLHMPHFRGRDVYDLQCALSSLGFVCAADTVFGPRTEWALRQFQENMSLEPTGILDGTSATALHRLRHAWEGKRGLVVEGRDLGFLRSIKVLECTPVCFYGTNSFTQALASRISNLALATSAQSRIVCASALSAGPARDMLLIGLVAEVADTAGESTASLQHTNQAAAPLVVPFDESGEQERALRAAIAAARAYNNRFLIALVPPAQTASDHAHTCEQQLATRLLDALCAALEPR